MGQFRKTTCSLHWGVLAAALALSPSSFTWFPRRKMKIIMIMIMMMMLPMQSWFRPEADPAVLLAWIETEEDLTAIHNAAKVWAFVGSLRHSEPLKLQLFAIFTRLSSCSVALITQENYYSINAYTILYHTIPYNTIQHLTFGVYLRTCAWHHFPSEHQRLLDHSESRVCKWVLEEGADSGVFSQNSKKTRIGLRLMLIMMFSFPQVVYELYPGIMTGLKNLNRKVNS